MNKVMLVGNLGADPELRLTANNTPVATLRVATSQGWKNKNGQKLEATEWHRVIVWGSQAETLKQYLSKGRQVAVEGRIQSREWTDRDGVRRRTTEIVAQRVQMLGAKSTTSASAPVEGEEPPANIPEPAEPEPVAVGDDDIAF